MTKQWTAKDVPDQTGKRAIVTGANSGVGFQTARELARAGAEVVLACRSAERGEAAAAEIRAEQPGAKVEAGLLDLSTLASVRAFAERVSGKPLDILVNNAGISITPKREVTPDGFEKQLATNYLGHFALTGLLLPSLLQATAPRVVSVSSLAHTRAKFFFDDFQLERSYNPLTAYGQSKLAMLVYARELERRSREGGGKLVSIGAHPGISKTAIGKEGVGLLGFATKVYIAIFGRDEAQSALPQLYAAVAPDAEPGSYYGPDGAGERGGYPASAKVAPQAAESSAGPRLWELSEQATKVVYDWAPARG